MNKAILVLDMPKTCEDCPCNQIETNYGGIDRTFCGITDYTTSSRGKLENCPLKPLLHKDFIDEAESYQTESEYKAYISGWNDCLDEILGE